jgi:hypothetical protein
MNSNQFNHTVVILVTNSKSKPINLYCNNSVKIFWEFNMIAYDK